MAVMVDDAPLEVGELGFSTVGEVLSHVANNERLIVQVLIDGAAPDLSQFEQVKQTRLDGRTLFIETASPRLIASEALSVVEGTIEQAETLRADAAEAFRSGDAATGMQKLSSCFGLWNNAQDSFGKVAQLLRVDLTQLSVKDSTSANATTAEAVISRFASSLRELVEALQARDYVLCCDVLTYEMENVGEDWRQVITALRRVAAA